MTVMLANNTGVRTGYLAGRFPGKIGHLFSPGGQRGPYEFIPYALDNNRFGAWKNQKEWSETAWIQLLDWARLSSHCPRWAIVPDVVADRERTLEEWSKYSPLVSQYAWPLAFAVQDGMTPSDVPMKANVVFVGGTTDWKWSTVPMWCSEFPRVHVGRVNTYKRLWQCHDAGVKSVDGTGWMRGDQKQYRGLLTYLEESTGLRHRVQQSVIDFAA